MELLKIWLLVAIYPLGILFMFMTLYVLAMGIGKMRNDMEKKRFSKLKIEAFSFVIWVPVIFTIWIIRNF